MKVSRLFFSSSLLLIAILFKPSPVLGVLPEPHNILYGTVSLDGALLTAASTNVVLEARRSPSGPVVASYRMGSNPQYGNFYALQIPIESVAPITNATNSQVGDRLSIRLLDVSGLRGQTNFTVFDRGTVIRADFGAGDDDTDRDGLPDAWELAYFGGLAKTGFNVGSNRLTLAQNYILGTNPNDPNDVFRLSINRGQNEHEVSFRALRATGPGYAGKARYYTLEFNTASFTNFATVPGYTNILGDNQTVFYQSGLPTNVFFRGRAVLRLP